MPEPDKTRFEQLISIMFITSLSKNTDIEISVNLTFGPRSYEATEIMKRWTQLFDVAPSQTELGFMVYSDDEVVDVPCAM